MELEDIQKVLDEYLSQDKNRGGLILLTDKEKSMYFASGTREVLVGMLYSLLMSDKQELLIDCMDKAASMYFEEKDKRQGRTMLKLFAINQNKYKS